MNVYDLANVPDPSTTTAAAWDGIANTVNSSALPTGLTTGTTAIWIGTTGNIGSEKDNARFICAGDLSTVASIKALIYDQTKWQTSDNEPVGFVLPTGCSYIAAVPATSFTTQPLSTTICAGVNASFTIVATGATTYQWQVDNGGGFANLSNDATYSNVTTTTLNITAAPFSLNGYLYRCVASNGTGPTNSNSATLTVTPLPVNPTLLAKTPATSTVADGTPVSATFNAGSGGTGCADDFRYTTNGGASYLPYTPGSNISTTGLAAADGTVTIEGRKANCSAGCQGTYDALASWIVTPLPAGATTLNAGDIAFSGYTSSTANSDFSFVLLRNIGPGTVINFTDNGWLSTNVFRTGETTVTWTSNAAYSAGTEIMISALNATLTSGASAGTVTGTALSLSVTGDQILAYRGTAASPTFISAIHMNVYTVANGDPATTSAAAWDGAANTIFSSALPTGLTTGTNAIWIGTSGDINSEFDNAKYGTCTNPATFGPISTLRAALNNQANWTKDNNVIPSFVLPTGCSYIGIGSSPNISTQPSASSICAGANTSFTIVATGATTYQWQVDNGGGFVNLTNDATYSNVTTATLNITAATVGLNGYLYRCIATNGSGSTNSNSAALTVTILPVNPTLLVKTPTGSNVADGTPVSATFTAGSGGTGCADDYRYTTDGGVTYLPYTPGSNISTTGLAVASGTVFIEGRRANCTSSCQAAYSVLASWTVTPLPAAATTLNAGDIAFSGYNSSTGSDEFSFVLLKNIGVGTVINFTNNGWLSTNVFRTGEETVTWTAPAGGMAAGTEIKIAGLIATKSGGGAAGTVTGTALSLGINGDQVLAYRGTAAAPTFISAIHMNVYSTTNADPVTTTAAAWDGAANTANASALPTGLTTSVNAIWIGTQGDINTEFDNAKYGTCANPATLGAIATLRAALNNQTNWSRNNGTGFILPTGCNYLSALVPSVSVIGTPLTAFISCIGSVSAEQSFSVSGSALTVNITITAPTGFEISTTSGSGFAPSLALTQSGGTVNATTIFVRIAASATGTPSGNITLASTGVTTINVAVSGTVNPLPATPSISAGGATTFCAGDNVVLTSSSATGNTWSTGATTPSITVTTAGTYTVTVTSGGCTSAASAGTIVTVNPIPATPTITAGGPTTFCTGSSVVLTSSSATGNLWSTGATTPSITVTAGGTYTVTVTSGGCTSAPSAGTNVTVNPLPATPTITAGGPTTFCTGGSVVLTSSSATGNVWSTGATTPSIIVTTAGTYTVTVTIGGCTSAISAGTTVSLAPDNTISFTSAVGTNAQTVPVNSVITNITYATTGATGATVTGLPAGVSGIWSANVVTISGSPTTAVGSPFNYIVTLTGGCGSITALGTITVLPCTTPTITCPGNISLSNTTGTCGRVVTYTTTTGGTPAPTVTYAFTGATTASGSGDGSGNTFNVGTTNVTVTVTNVCGNTNCSFTVTINDTQAPTVTVGTIGSCYPTVAAAQAAALAATSAIDNCPGALSEVASTVGTCSAVVTVRTTDLAGNFTDVTYNTRIDNAAPTVTVGTIGSCYPTVAAAEAAALAATSATDNCPGALTEVASTVGTCSAVITVTTTDGCGNATTITYNTRIDNTAPTVTVGTIGSCYPTVAAAEAAALAATSATDNCPGALTEVASTVGTCSAVITVTTTDGCGNSTAITYNTRIDNTAPTVTVGTIGSCYPTVAAAEAAALAATSATDNCPGGLTEVASTVGTCSAVITVTTTDGCGNGTAVTYNTRIDNIAPTVTVGTIGSCYPTVAAAEAAALAATSATDNCSGALTEIASTVGTCSAVVTVTTTDGCGNATAITYNTRIDNIAPTVTCPIAITVCGAAGVPIVNIASVTATDNCTGAIIITHQGDVSTPSTTAPYNIVRTYRATDGCGNFTDCTQIITVNPIATVNTIANQVVCNNAPTTAVTFTSPTTGGTIVYNWTNNTPSIGLATSGSGNIASFNAVNTGTVPVVATITVTPSYTNAGVTCVGTPITHTYTVNPTATVTAVANQVVCNNSPTTAIAFTSPTIGGTIVYNWTNNTTSIGLAASGVGNIASFNAVNTTTAPVVATITVTPSYTNAGVTCVGTASTFTITVNPTPMVNAITNQVLCNNFPTTAVTFTSPTTGGTIVYNWTNNTTSIGLAASGTGNIASFTATNTTQVPVVATITVTPSYTNAGVTCVGTPTTFTITVNPTPIVTLAPFAAICRNGAPLTLTGGLPLVTAGTTGIYLVDNIPQTIFNPANYTPGLHTIVYVYTNIYGCVNRATQTILVHPIHTVEITVAPNSGVAPGSPVTVIATVSPVDNYTYAWSKNNVLVPLPNADRIVVLANDAGNYSVRVTAPTGCVVVSSSAFTASANVPQTLFIFPNPSSGIFNVAYNNGGANLTARTLNVYDGKGAVVFSRSYSVNVPFGNMRVDISQHAKGQYYVVLTDSNGQKLASATVQKL
jgi:large repetitive protein